MEVHLNFQLFQQGTEDLSEWLHVTLLKAVVAKWFEPWVAGLSLRAGGQEFSPAIMKVTPAYFCRKKKKNRTKQNP